MSFTSPAALSLQRRRSNAWRTYGRSSASCEAKIQTCARQSARKPQSPSSPICSSFGKTRFHVSPASPNWRRPFDTPSRGGRPIEIDSNIVERAIRPQTITRKNSLFAGSDGGGRTWAAIATLLQTAKMNDIDPLAWLTQTLERLANGWPNAEIDALMPWHYAA